MQIEELKKERAILSDLIEGLHKEANRAGSAGRKKRLASSLALSSLLYLCNRKKLKEAQREAQKQV